MEYASSQATGAVISWWKKLHSDHGDKGARARLKRCDCVLDALLEPETHRLIAHVRGDIPDKETQYLAVLAIVLAQVKPSETGRGNQHSFPEVLGRTGDGAIPTGDARRRLSPMRFSTLLRAGNDPDRFIQVLRRTVAIMGGTSFDVRRFVQDVLTFNDGTRQRWTFDYYHTRRVDTRENAHALIQPSNDNQQ